MYIKGENVSNSKTKEEEDNFSKNYRNIDWNQECVIGGSREIKIDDSDKKEES